MILNDPQWSLMTSMTHNVHNEPLGASRSLQEPQWPQWPQSALMTAMRHEPQWVSMNLNDPQWPQWPSMTSNSLKEPQWSSMTSMTWMSLNDNCRQARDFTSFLFYYCCTGNWTMFLVIFYFSDLAHRQPQVQVWAARILVQVSYFYIT